MKKTTVFWALIALNAALLAGLIAPYFHSNQAMAQRAGGGRRPDLMLVPGEIIGGNSAVVYLVDTANRRLGAISLNQRGTALDSLAPQPLDRVFEERQAEEPAGGAAGGKNRR